MENKTPYCNICGELIIDNKEHKKTKEHKYWKKIDDLFLHNKDIIKFISSDLGKYKSNVIINDDHGAVSQVALAVQTNKTNSIE